MQSAFSFRVRREYLRLSAERHSELTAASGRSWKPCCYAMGLSAIVVPLAIVYGAVLVVRALPTELPLSARLIFRRRRVIGLVPWASANLQRSSERGCASH
jgi:hypothetical protein